MNPVACEIDRPKVRDEFGAFSRESQWYGSPRAPIGPQRLTDTLPSFRQKSHSASLLEPIKFAPERGVSRFFGLLETPTPRWSPRHHAETTRELIQAVQKEAEDRRVREVRRLQRRIAALTRELAFLKHEKTQPDLGDAVTVYGLDIPESLTHVIAAVEESRPLLELGEDWDGNGTPGFTEHTWRRAAGLLVCFASALAGEHGVIAKDMEILPGSNGGLDIDVRFDDRQLLFVVSADSRKEVRFYGDNGNGGRQIKATLDPAKAPEWLSTWMAE